MTKEELKKIKELSERQRIILELIIANPFLSAKAISEKIPEKTSKKASEKMSEKRSEKMSEKEGVNERTIERDLAKLKKLGILTREGGRKEGKWVISERIASHKMIYEKNKMNKSREEIL